METQPTEVITNNPTGELSIDKSICHYVFKHLPAAVYTCDELGYIQSFNDAAVALWGRKPEIGKDLWCGSWKIFKTDGSPLPLDLCPMAITLKEKRPVFNEEIIVERPDHTRRHVIPHPQPIFDSNGMMTGAMNMLVDITENKKILAANEVLKYYNEQLEQFAYAASHDLQEPLRKISIFSEMLKEHTLDEQGHFFIEKIIDASKRMTSLIRDLLDYTKEAQHTETIKEVNLNNLINQILIDLEIVIKEKNAIVKIDELPLIKAAPAEMNRLFYNLINNALKFSKSSHTPIIKIRYKKEPEAVIFEIHDNGIGFKQEYATKIFDFFERLDNNQSMPGNGIGLSLCKKIVENHQGQIYAEAIGNQGSIFYIKFPASIIA